MKWCVCMRFFSYFFNNWKQTELSVPYIIKGDLVTQRMALFGGNSSVGWFMGVWQSNVFLTWNNLQGYSNWPTFLINSVLGYSCSILPLEDMSRYCEFLSLPLSLSLSLPPPCVCFNFNTSLKLISSLLFNRAQHRNPSRLGIINAQHRLC